MIELHNVHVIQRRNVNKGLTSTLTSGRDLYKKEQEKQGADKLIDVLDDLDDQRTESNEVDNAFIAQADSYASGGQSEEVDDEMKAMMAEIDNDKQRDLAAQMLNVPGVPVKDPRNTKTKTFEKNVQYDSNSNVSKNQQQTSQTTTQSKQNQRNDMSNTEVEKPDSFSNNNESNQSISGLFPATPTDNDDNNTFTFERQNNNITKTSNRKTAVSVAAPAAPQQLPAEFAQMTKEEMYQMFLHQQHQQQLQQQQQQQNNSTSRNGSQTSKVSGSATNQYQSMQTRPVQIPYGQAKKQEQQQQQNNSTTTPENEQVEFEF
jgi:hypothetical protein